MSNNFKARNHLVLLDRLIIMMKRRILLSYSFKQIICLITGFTSRWRDWKSICRLPRGRSHNSGVTDSLLLVIKLTRFTFRPDCQFTIMTINIRPDTRLAAPLGFWITVHYYTNYHENFTIWWWAVATTSSLQRSWGVHAKLSFHHNGSNLHFLKR